MKKLILLVVALAVLVAAVPSSASAKAGIKSLARAECKEDRRTEPAEFAADFGGTGSAAMRRCIKREIRGARADCREDRREEPAEFAAEYGGTGKQALKRCIRDEIR